MTEVSVKRDIFREKLPRIGPKRVSLFETDRSSRNRHT